MNARSEILLAGAFFWILALLVVPLPPMALDLSDDLLVAVPVWWRPPMLSSWVCSTAELKSWLAVVPRSVTDCP